MLQRVLLLSLQSEPDTEAEPPTDHPERNLPGREGGSGTRLGLGEPGR